MEPKEGGTHNIKRYHWANKSQHTRDYKLNSLRVQDRNSTWNNDFFVDVLPGNWQFCIVGLRGVSDTQKRGDVSGHLECGRFSVQLL